MKAPASREGSPLPAFVESGRKNIFRNCGNNDFVDRGSTLTGTATRAPVKEVARSARAARALGATRARGAAMTKGAQIAAMVGGRGGEEWWTVQAQGTLPNELSRSSVAIGGLLTP